MPSIPISDALFARLQRHAVPLVDSGESLLARILDGYEAWIVHANGADTGIAAGGTTSGKPAEIRTTTYDPASPPNLTHTKLLSATLDGARLATKTNWKSLRDAMIRKVTAHAKSSEDLGRLILANFVAGRKEDEGYEYIPDLDLSIQGQDADHIWKCIYHIAQRIGCQVEVVFMWRAKPKAEHPGETGRLAV
jgi:hypothetical protein